MEKTQRITYPLFLIPLEAGYLSVVESNDSPAGGDTCFLAVFTQAGLAADFMTACGIEGEPRPLHNGREFAWLLHRLRAPIDHVAFDPHAGAKRVLARWKVTVAEALAKHISIDYSPWNYPVYYIQQPDGLVSIEGQTSNQDKLVAVGLFTTEDHAREYLDATQSTGEIRPLEDLAQTREFLESLLPVVTAVALNITLAEGRQSARYCFSIATVLEKYLVGH